MLLLAFGQSKSPVNKYLYKKAITKKRIKKDNDASLSIFKLLNIVEKTNAKVSMYRNLLSSNLTT